MIPNFYRERMPSEPEPSDPVVEQVCEGMRLVAQQSSSIEALKELEDDPRVSARFVFPGEIGDLLLEFLQADAAKAKLSMSFRLFYRLRPLIPIFLRQLLQRGRNQNLQVAEDWFIPHEFEQRLRGLLTTCPDRQVIHPWPDGFEMCAVLTHDVETEEGAGRVLEIAQLEEEFGFRSAWNFIPYKYPIDPVLLDELQARGHEVGMHGFNHDGRLFESRDTFRNRSGPINDVLRKFQCGGFRAPMVHRNLLWMQILDIDYDCSCFDTDPFQAMPGGVGGVWPFFAGKFVELPYTLPQDHTLFVALGQESTEVWIRKFQWLRRLSGMAMLVTHPDYLDTPSRLDTYRQFLSYLREQQDSCWMSLPREVSMWWRQRDGLEILQQSDSRSEVIGAAAERATSVTLADLFHEFLESA